MIGRWLAGPEARCAARCHWLLPGIWAGRGLVRGRPLAAAGGGREVGLEDFADWLSLSDGVIKEGKRSRSLELKCPPKYLFRREDFGSVNPKP